MAFIDSTEQQQIPRPVDNNKRCIIQARRKDILLSRIRLWLIIVVVSFIKQQTIRKEENMTTYSIYKKNHPVTHKLLMWFIGVFRSRKRFPRTTIICLTMQKEKKPMAITRREKVQQNTL
jgi:hypothetical protein